MTDNRNRLSRRAFAGAVAAAGVSGLNAADKPARRKTFVFVHGTWHGGWVWRDVRRNLAGRGHDVFTPSCTGCGDRKHLMSPDIGLDTHITDITNLIEYEELQDVILVGHSFAGLTITGVADRMKDRIQHLVYLDALVPGTDKMSGVMRNEDGSFTEFWLKREAKFIDGYQMDYFAEYPLEMLVPADDEENKAWLRRRITPHPARGWSDIVALSNGGWEGLPRTFLHCVGQEYQQTSMAMIGPAKEPGWDYRAMPWSRDAMVTHPTELADLLDEFG